MVALILLVALGVFLFTLVAGLIAARSPIQRKWLWVVIALLGAPGKSIDWTNGRFLDGVVPIQVLSVGFWPSLPYSHWRLTLAFPLGAVIFLARRRALIVQAAAHAEQGGG